MARRNSIEPPAYNSLYESNPSYSTLPPVYIQAPDSNSRSAADSSAHTPRTTTQPNYRRHSHSHISRTIQDDPDTTPQRLESPSSGASSYESQPTNPEQPTSSSSPQPAPTSFRAKYRAALAADRERRETRVQRISGTEAQRITGNAERRREENIRIGRRASFGDEDFSRDGGDDESNLSPEALRRKQQREAERKKGGAGILMFLAF